MSVVMIIPEFNMRLCGPTSTSKHKEVAMKFAGRGGMIIQLNNNGDERSRNSLSFFDCSWISRYSIEEEERLFIGGAWMIRIESIIVIETKNNYEQQFHALFYLDAMLSGGVYAAVKS
eukprot:379015_1